MATDFYIDDFGGDFYDGSGGSGDFFYVEEPAFETVSFEPIDYAPEFELLPQQETQFFDLTSFESEPLPFEPLPGEFESFEFPTVDQFTPLPDLPIFPETSWFTEVPLSPLPEIGFLEPLPPIDLFAETIQMETETGGLIEQPVTLPTIQTPVIVPTLIDNPFLDFFPLPFVPDPLPVPAPPAPEKLGPCDTPNGLPGPCAQGFYHPQENPCACVPFPPAPAPSPTPSPTPTTTAPKPSSPTPSPSPAPSPTQQTQTCPTGYCKHPTTGQCMQIPVGYVRHPQTQICTLATQAPASTEPNVLASLKEIPLWVWLVAGGALLLSQSGGRR